MQFHEFIEQLKKTGPWVRVGSRAAIRRRSKWLSATINVCPICEVCNRLHGTRFSLLTNKAAEKLQLSLDDHLDIVAAVDNNVLLLQNMAEKSQDWTWYHRVGNMRDQILYACGLT